MITLKSRPETSFKKIERYDYASAKRIREYEQNFQEALRHNDIHQMAHYDTMIEKVYRRCGVNE